MKSPPLLFPTIWPPILEFSNRGNFGFIVMDLIEKSDWLSVRIITIITIIITINIIIIIMGLIKRSVVQSVRVCAIFWFNIRELPSLELNF